MSRLDFPPRTGHPVDDPDTLLRWLDSIKPKAGVWTPAITFATPGDLAVAYSTQVGLWYRLGDLVYADFELVTSSFTFTTAAGAVSITGLPYTSKNMNQRASSAIRFGGITKATYTCVITDFLPAATSFQLAACGSGVAPSSVVAADMPTGGSVVLRGQFTYLAD